MNEYSFINIHDNYEVLTITWEVILLVAVIVVEYWNIGILECWFQMEVAHLLVFYLSYQGYFADEALIQFPRTHISIIPAFQHSLRGVGPTGRRPIVSETN